MTLSIKEKVTKFTSENQEELILHRRWFHQHPETSFKEFKTSAYLQQYFQKIGATNYRTISTTGIICEIGEGDLTHAARFNMDGLPIPEKNDVPFCSLFQGYSHSCGHDFELAWGLMMTKYFQENKPDGKIRLIFQPAEEGPGDEAHGKTGGQVLAELGAFNVDSIISLHVEPEVPLGTMSLADGEVTCSAFDFTFTLHGKTCHAAKPHQGINPIPIGADIINSIYQLNKEIESKKGNEEEYIMITVSSFTTRLQLDKQDIEETINTIPEYAILKGISRVRSKSVKDRLVKGLKNIESIFASKLQNCKLNIHQVALATINDKNCVENSIEAAYEHNVKVISKRTTWRDDAGWASDKAPTSHGFIGIYDGKPITLHSPYFNPTEDALPIGLTILLGTMERNLLNLKMKNKYTS